MILRQGHVGAGRHFRRNRIDLAGSGRDGGDLSRWIGCVQRHRQCLLVRWTKLQNECPPQGGHSASDDRGLPVLVLRLLTLARLGGLLVLLLLLLALDLFALLAIAILLLRRILLVVIHGVSPCSPRPPE